MKRDREIYKDPKVVQKRFNHYLKDIAKVSTNRQHKEARVIRKRFPKEMRKLVKRVKTSLGAKTLKTITDLVKPLTAKCSENKRREIVWRVAKLMEPKHYKA